MTKQEKYEINLRRHIQELRENLGFTGDYAALQSIERRGRMITLDYANGKISTDSFSFKDAKLEKELAKLFKGGKLPQGVFTNSDPRGAYLKLDSDFNPFNQETYRNLINCRDWGGNGILVPSRDSLI